MSTARFVKLIDMPERTWRRWQAKARQDRGPKGPWLQPARKVARDLVVGMRWPNRRGGIARSGR